MTDLGFQTPVPGYDEAVYQTQDEILFSTVGYTQKGRTFKAGQGVIAGGTIVGRITADKTWAPAVVANVDGTEVARAVLRHTIDTTDDVAGKSVLGNIVIMGIMKNDKVVDSNAGADRAAFITQLNASVDATMNTFKI